MVETPLPPSEGISPARERRWGLVGGVTGSLVGIGSAAVAIGLDGAAWNESGPYPSIFEKTELLAFDLYLLVVLAAGAGFSLAAILHARKGRFPRTDGFGAGLMGVILSALAGTILFVRLLALLAAT